MDDGWWMTDDEWWMMNDEWWMMDDDDAPVAPSAIVDGRVAPGGDIRVGLKEQPSWIARAQGLLRGFRKSLILYICFFVGHKKPTGKGKKQNIRTALLSSIVHLSQDLWMIPETWCICQESLQDLSKRRALFRLQSCGVSSHLGWNGLKHPEFRTCQNQWISPCIFLKLRPWRIKKENVATKDAVVEVLLEYGVRTGCTQEYAHVCGTDGFLDYSLWIDQALRLREQQPWIEKAFFSVNFLDEILPMR